MTPIVPPVAAPGQPPDSGVVIVTPRLVLRRFVEDDAPFVLELLNEDGFLRHIGDRGVRTLEQARAYVRDGPQASYARHGHGLWCVVRTGDRAAIGMSGLLRRDALDAPDLGYAFLASSWGNGYAIEAAAAVVGYARDPLHVERVLAIVSPGNDRSIHLLARLGFVPEGTTRLKAEAPEVRLFAKTLGVEPVAGPPG